MKSLVIAPHPDDELLGVGGTILKRKSQGHSIAWLIFTEPSNTLGWKTDQIKQRNDQIIKVRDFIGFEKVYELRFPAAELETLPYGIMMNRLKECIDDFQPEEVFMPHPGDIHSDHSIVAKCTESVCKSFRAPFIRRVLSYETLSETEQSYESSFRPTVFINIEKELEKKLKALRIYESELKEFPFPRSEEAIQSLARYRGCSSGYSAAEAFAVHRIFED
jgi:N-acetylglucosamine malate deacetylase 1